VDRGQSALVRAPSGACFPARGERAPVGWHFLGRDPWWAVLRLSCALTPELVVLSHGVKAAIEVRAGLEKR